MSSAQRTGLLFGILAAAIWGGMYVVSKLVLAAVPPFTLLVLRLALGTASLALWIRVRRLPWPQLTGKQWVRLLGVGVLGYGFSLGLQFTGTHLSTAANGAVITAATPAFVYLFAWLLLREPIGRRQLVALALSTLGVLLIVDPFQADLSQRWLGDLLLAGAAVTWALYSVLTRQATRQLDTLAFTLVAFIGGLVVAVPAAGLELRTSNLAPMSTGVLAGVLYLGVISTAVAAYLWNKAFALLPARMAALTFFAQPLVGAGLGIGLLGEVFTLQFAIGALLILLCLWLVSRGDRID